MSDHSIGDDRTNSGGGRGFTPSRPPPAENPGSDGRTLGDGRTFVPNSPSAEHAPGTVIDGRFEILGPLGRGGMGQVYRARDQRLGRQVALKRLLGSGAMSGTARERFDREAKAIAALQHSGIVTLHDYGADAQGPYLVMELLEGSDLGTWVKQHGALPVKEVLRVAREICRALAYAHGRDVIHRDLKPSNLFRLPDGTIKLLDFGLARVEEDASLSQPQLSVVGVGMGTADYAAPEQREDASSADARSDIYSLGATLYFLASGKSPRMMSERHLPEQIRELVVSLVEERPADRPASIAEVLEAISRAESLSTVESAPEETDDLSCPSCKTPNAFDRS